jgi:hypothetical protein
MNPSSIQDVFVATEFVNLYYKYDGNHRAVKLKARPAYAYSGFATPLKRLDILPPVVNVAYKEGLKLAVTEASSSPRLLMRAFTVDPRSGCFSADVDYVCPLI